MYINENIHKIKTIRKIKKYVNETSINENVYEWKLK